MDLASALDAARQNTQSTLVTMRGSGLPQLSNVLHAVGEAADGATVLRISTTADRAKFANLQRRPWAAVKLDAGSFWSYVVLEGPVTLSEVAADPQDAVVEELVGLYRQLSGEHEDWSSYRAAMVAERRLVVRVHPDHAYGMLR